MNPIAKGFFHFFMGMQVFLYRLTNGRMGGRMRDFNVLLLTTTGRKTGRQRTNPLGYIRDGECYVIVASNAGRDPNPAWYLNLEKNPQVQIQVGGQTLQVRADAARGEERQRLWSQVVSEMPSYAEYPKHTTREIPIVVLTPQAR